MTGRTGTFMQNVAVVTDSPYIRVINPPPADATVQLTPEPAPTETETAATVTAGAAEKKSTKKQKP